MPSPEDCKNIDGPQGPGVYQVRNIKTDQLIQFGIGIKCQKRMKSLFPSPYGSGTRKNPDKRDYILKYWMHLAYRTYSTDTREEAARIEAGLKAQHNHLFNT